MFGFTPMFVCLGIAILIITGSAFAITRQKGAYIELRIALVVVDVLAWAIAFVLHATSVFTSQHDGHCYVVDHGRAHEVTLETYLYCVAWARWSFWSTVSVLISTMVPQWIAK